MGSIVRLTPEAAVTGTIYPPSIRSITEATIPSAPTSLRLDAA